MAAKQVIVKTTTKTRKRVTAPKSKGKGQKRCSNCGKYM